MPASVLSLSLRVAVASAVTVDRDAVAGPEEKEEEEEETTRRSVWEERCSGCCLGDRTGMVEDNSLHRTDVAPAKRSTALRTKTAGRCMECRCYSCEMRALAGVDDPISAGPDYGHAALRQTKSDHIVCNKP